MVTYELQISLLQVGLFYEDGSLVEAKGIGRKILDMVYKTYESEMGGKGFAYDGPLVLYLQLISSSMSFWKMPHQIAQVKEKPKDRGVCLNRSSIRGCLPVRQCYFQNDSRNFISIGGGVVGCKGFHSSFRATRYGLSLNMDVSTTMIIKSGKVMDFLFENQNVRSLREIDWIKAKRILKNLRVKTLPSNLEYKIIGLSEKTCREQRFSLKQKNQRDGYSPSEAIDITMFQYYANYRQIHLEYSIDCPCLDVGKPKKLVYIPLEIDGDGGETCCMRKGSRSLASRYLNIYWRYL
ncbi:unnamed protein product [Lactuca saligna]|uniref:PAZ domain-containing protein n=1 Tax=Lactuca saligna TaxID=75948 RepID=A0AA36EI74_LACSI|nr:unnamed protein product [Lactuca saligna]